MWLITNATGAPFKVCYVIQTSFFKQRNDENAIQYLIVKWHGQVKSFDKVWAGTTIATFIGCGFSLYGHTHNLHGLHQVHKS